MHSASTSRTKNIIQMEGNPGKKRGKRIPCGVLPSRDFLFLSSCLFAIYFTSETEEDETGRRKRERAEHYVSLEQHFSIFFQGVFVSASLTIQEARGERKEAKGIRSTITF